MLILKLVLVMPALLMIRLSVGGRFKVLLGMGNFNLKVNGMNVDANLPLNINDITDVNQIRDYHAKMKVNAHLKSSFKGMDLVENTSDPDPRKHYIDDFDFNGFGIAGYGGAIDLGASYKILDNLTVSASVWIWVLSSGQRGVQVLQQLKEVWIMMAKTMHLLRKG